METQDKLIFKWDVNYRKQCLLKLFLAIQSYEGEIIKALYADFKKPAFESVATETGYILAELRYTIKSIHNWAKPKFVFPSLLNFPSADYIYKEPFGKVLIIAPWNYPFQLVFSPLIAAVAAGNQVVVKPSELASNTSALIAKIIQETFDKRHVSCIQGGPEVTQGLLSQRWDYIFFTGSVAVGKLVASAAATHLTPVTLELGGKNPCIVDETASLKLAAKRIVWGKFINAGQTCIAPDYILVHQKVKAAFIEYLKDEIVAAYGQNPEISPDFARIINEHHFKRIQKLLQNETVLFGGETTASDFYIAPTLIYEPRLEGPVMQQEIFGPILPILSYQNESDIANILLKREKPLALYVFTSQPFFAKKMIEGYSFGGGCINDTVIHFANKKLPFGGVGYSGNGAYHGRLGFTLFSHQKSIVKKAIWLDIPFRYAPYQGKLHLLKKVLKWLS